jgi:hypothetical protein
MCVEPGARVAEWEPPPRLARCANGGRGPQWEPMSREAPGGGPAEREPLSREARCAAGVKGVPSGSPRSGRHFGAACPWGVPAAWPPLVQPVYWGYLSSHSARGTLAEQKVAGPK